MVLLLQAFFQCVETNPIKVAILRVSALVGVVTTSVRKIQVAVKTPSHREGCGWLSGGGEGFRSHAKAE